MPSTATVSRTQSNAIDPGVVAGLCDQRIAILSRSELIAVISACQHLWTGEDLSSRLPFAEDGLLRRLAYLARQCCRVRAVQGQRDLAT